MRRRALTRSVLSAAGGATALAVLALSGPAAAASDDTVAGMEMPEDYAFAITRKGNKIGEHRIAFSRGEDGLVADIDIDIKVSFGPIPLFRYSHSNREVWRDGRLVSIDTETRENGDNFSVEGYVEGDSFVVEGREGRMTAARDILPTSYWRREMVEASTLLDTQRGRLLDMVEERQYTDEETGDECFELTGDLDLTLCYQGRRLTQLEFRFDGNEIIYQPLTQES